jgi:Protein of unknown function (DUF3006)
MPTWIIDSLEEDSAQIEEDGVRVIHTPRSILPEGAREGDVLIVTREDVPAGKGTRATDSVRITITLDQGATRAAKFKSRQQVRRISEASKKLDPGGDVIL